MIATGEWRRAIGANFAANGGKWGYAQLKHYTAQYCEWGEGPPLLLIPGMAGGLELLGPLAERLASGYRVISYQLRGEDDCFALRRPFDLADLVTDLSEFQRELCLEQPAVLGVSFGGVLALKYAARFPHAIRALAVQGVGARFEQGLLHRVASLILPRYPLPTDNPFVNQFFNLLFGGRQRPGELFDFVTRRCWQTDQSVMAHRFKLIAELDLTPLMDKIAVPTLVMTSDRDMLVSERSARELCEALHEVRCVRFKGCGHLAFVTRPEQVADTVSDFLAQLESRS